jgi:hypothetical protein
LRIGLCLFAQRLSTISVCRRAVVAAGDCVRLRSLRFAPTHIHRPYCVCRPHSLSSRGRYCLVVARSSLRAITFVCARCASLQLTSIAPTPLTSPIITDKIGALLRLTTQTFPDGAGSLLTNRKLHYQSFNSAPKRGCHFVKEFCQKEKKRAEGRFYFCDVLIAQIHYGSTSNPSFFSRPP